MRALEGSMVDLVGSMHASEGKTDEWFKQFVVRTNILCLVIMIKCFNKRDIG